MKTHVNNPLNSSCTVIFIVLFSHLFFSCSNEDIQENLSGKEGFSMVSADRRIEEVFAFSEYGSLNDTTYNEGLKMFCKGLPYYIEDKIKNFNTDSLYKTYKQSI